MSGPRILILGSKGRLGAALARRWRAAGYAVQALARPECDISDLPSLRRILTETPFDVLVNGMALTHVDRCETDRDEARVVNAEAPRVMAEAAVQRGARLIHFSTDYVFDGRKETPYQETDPARPLGHYGQTKLDGENAVLNTSARHLVVRVSWVFGSDKPSFVDMILERARTQDRVEAVADKTSCPTFSEDAADWMEPFLVRDLPGGLYHACNAGTCTWQEYGQEALDVAARLGWPLRTHQVEPLPLSALKTFSAPRPPHTALDTAKLARTTGLTPRPWQEALAAYLASRPVPAA